MSTIEHIVIVAVSKVIGYSMFAVMFTAAATVMTAEATRRRAFPPHTGRHTTRKAAARSIPGATQH